MSNTTLRKRVIRTRRLVSHVIWIIALVVPFSSKGQQGLFLSTARASGVNSNHRIDIPFWYQPEKDKKSFGASYTYSPYFSKSQSELRLRGGFFGTSDKFNTAKDITYYLIAPNSPLLEMGLGYTKLFPQNQANSNYDIAFNADFYYGMRFFSVRKTPYLSDGHNKVRISSYHFRGGLEIIPIPGILSLYGNMNFLMGISGKQNYEDAFSSTIDLLEKAEYWDAGVRLMITPCKKCKSLQIIPDVNFIFTEKRIRDKTINADDIIPDFKLNVTYSFPSK